MYIILGVILGRDGAGRSGVHGLICIVVPCRARKLLFDSNLFLCTDVKLL